MSWHHKAEKIIAAECLSAYREAGNKPGKKHNPYRVPPLASALVDALNKNDENEAKRLFVIWHTGTLSLI